MSDRDGGGREHLVYGSLFSGYEGLTLGVQSVWPGRTAWHCEVDPGACRVLAHHWPDTPNLGDITAVDWTWVEPVDVVTGGYPCQPFSQAGGRRGEHDERHLWPYVREAIRHLRPRLAILENVAGHRSLGFDRVLGDLAEDGLHVRWASVRASDVGAPHQRERLFILAADAAQVGPEGAGWEARRGRAGSSVHDGASAPDSPAHRLARLGDRASGPAALRGRERDPVGDDRERPTATDIPRQRRSRGGAKSEGVPRRPDAAQCRAQDWGRYEPAIRRWERVTGRHAPRPVEQTRRGTWRLSPHFDEWFMGLAGGYLCDVPGLSWSQVLGLCGNGVVPQQATHALRVMLP